MKRVMLPVVLFLVGCGSGSGGGTQPSNSTTTAQLGQWEFVATPASGGQPFYLETNLVAGTSPNVFSTVFNTGLFQNVGPLFGGVGDCEDYLVNASISKGILSGAIDPAPPPGVPAPSATPSLLTFSGGVLSANGQSVTAGSYSSTSAICYIVPDQSSGTFTGYVVAPLSGTFSGTLSGAGQDQVAIQITQDSNFGITLSGTSLNAGLTTVLSMSPAGTPSDNIGFSNVIGATIGGSGTATTVNGAYPINIFGHFNPAGTQLSIVITGLAVETGTLTKQ